MDVYKRLNGYRSIQLNSLTVAAYSALKLTSLTTTIITAPWCAIKISAAAAADNFGWLGGMPSVFHLAAAAPDDSGWRRWRHSAADGSNTAPL